MLGFGYKESKNYHYCPAYQWIGKPGYCFQSSPSVGVSTRWLKNYLS